MAYGLVRMLAKLLSDRKSTTKMPNAKPNTNNFTDWLRNKRLTESTIRKYLGAISGPLSEWASTNGIYTAGLFNISDSLEFSTVSTGLMDLAIFKERNETGHQMYSAALSRYSEFLADRTGLGTQSRNSQLPSHLEEKRMEWVNLIQKMAPEYKLVNCKLNQKSPSFEFWNWRIAAEHKGNFGSVVLRWLGHSATPDSHSNWIDCARSDKEQGWAYRRKLQTNEFCALLLELQGCDLTEIQSREIHEQRVKAAMTLSPSERAQKSDAFGNIPRVYEVRTQVFDRNPYVVAEVLIRAKGNCEGCGQPAPFSRRTDSTPYLEVHHIKPLSKGGHDSIENAIGLCPNCHRKAHFG